MRDSINIGPVPPDEECEQLGTTYNPTKARKECQEYIKLLRRFFGPEPGSASLYIKSNPHDFGTYLEVECRFDDNDAEGQDYAFKCESDGPQYWDDWAMANLNFPTSEINSRKAHGTLAVFPNKMNILLDKDGNRVEEGV